MNVFNTLDNFVEICNHAIAISNRVFLTEYGSYVDQEWKSHYICYDLLQFKYKEIKGLQKSNRKKENEDSSKVKPQENNSLSSAIVHFDAKFRTEVQRAFDFLLSEAEQIDSEVISIEEEYEALTDEQKKEVLRKNENTKSSYRKIRSLYTRVDRLNAFFRLNEFAINKMGKKFDKVVKALAGEVETEIEAADSKDFHFSLSVVPNHVLTWECFSSYGEFSLLCPQWKMQYDKTLSKCIQLYTKIFRKTHQHIAEGELRFFKSKDGSRQTPYYIGFKVGFVSALGVWLLIDSLLLNSHFYYWKTPGLYVFSSIGGILIFKLMWVTSVWIWSTHNVNYIELFGAADATIVESRPSTANIVNHTMDLLITFIACLIFFYRVNSLRFHVHQVLEYLGPLILVILFLVYALYNLGPKRFHVIGMQFPSTNLFGWRVILRCICAPFYKVSFIDNFSADALTSFTRIISDALHAACWIVSGSFLKPVIPTEGKTFVPQTTDSYGSEHVNCTSSKMTLAVGLFMIIPLWIRYLQCMRNFYDNCSIAERKFPIFPHILNSVKYLLSIVVVLYGIFLLKVNSFYYFLIVFTTIYKWLWDVVVDWGLFHTFFNKGILGTLRTPVKDIVYLRPNLMYERKSVYVMAMLGDLILRFVWVVSLAPASLTSNIAKSALQVFMGALEIVRRGVWSIFRVENEHVNKLYGHALGVILEKKKITVEQSTLTLAEARLRSASIQSLQSLEQQLLNEASATETTSMKDASMRLMSAANQYCEVAACEEEEDDEDEDPGIITF